MGQHTAQQRGDRVAKADGSDQHHGRHRQEDQRKTRSQQRAERTGWGSERDNARSDGYVDR